MPPFTIYLFGALALDLDTVPAQVSGTGYFRCHRVYRHIVLAGYGRLPAGFVDIFPLRTANSYYSPYT